MVENAPRGEFQIDRDTQDVPGSPPVFETILAKIEEAVIFVPDLTFVGTRHGGKPVQNPNVLIEYGYALSHHGYPRIIAVMNAAYGEPTQENMPFNLGHRRFPIQYTLPEDAKEDARKAVRADLSKKLESAIKLLLESKEFSATVQSTAIERPRTVFDEAADYANEREFENALRRLGYGDGLETVRANARNLFVQIEEHCAQLRDRGLVEIDAQSKLWGERDQDNFCTVRGGGFAMQVFWKQPFAGSDRGANLVAIYVEGYVMLPYEAGILASRDTRRVNTKTFVPYLSRESDIGWAEKKPNMKEASYISNEELVDSLLTEFIQILKAPKRVRVPQGPTPSSGSPWS